MLLIQVKCNFYIFTWKKKDIGSQNSFALWDGDFGYLSYGVIVNRAEQIDRTDRENWPERSKTYRTEGLAVQSLSQLFPYFGLGPVRRTNRPFCLLGPDRTNPDQTECVRSGPRSRFLGYFVFGLGMSGLRPMLTPIKYGKANVL